MMGQGDDFALVYLDNIPTSEQINFNEEVRPFVSVFLGLIATDRHVREVACR
jgi:hypothetical protein